MNDLVLLEEENDIKLEDVFQAYYKCRKNKRNKKDCLEYDLDYEIHLIKLWENIKKGDYKVSPFSVFIVDKPVKREIFASSFEDRIVHHLIVMKLESLLEKEFIYDSYSCRVGRGTHFGINRVSKFIRKCSNNYQEECYVLKLDIKGYFMSINRLILIKKLESFLERKYFYPDKEVLTTLFKKVILNEVIKGCVIKSPKDKWGNLPKSKSLFHSKENCGLPIGNYTSQVFANFYLNEFDHFIKSKLKIKYYGRYVDDFVLVSKDKVKLVNAIPLIKEYLKEKLDLELHPKKIYFQDSTHGVEFLGSYIKHWRSYITPRIKNSFYLSVKEINNDLLKGKLTKGEKTKVQARLNSHLGTLVHNNTYNLRKKVIKMLNSNFYAYFSLSSDYLKVSIKKYS